jgi:hypothetical protein
LSNYERLRKIVGPDLLAAIERNLGGRLIRIRKSSIKVDMAGFRGKPLTVAAIMAIFHKSRSQAKRIKKLM